MLNHPQNRSCQPNTWLRFLARYHQQRCVAQGFGMYQLPPNRRVGGTGCSVGCDRKIVRFLKKPVGSISGVPFQTKNRQRYSKFNSLLYWNSSNFPCSSDVSSLVRPDLSDHLLPDHLLLRGHYSSSWVSQKVLMFEAGVRSCFSCFLCLFFCVCEGLQRTMKTVWVKVN